MSRSSPVLRLQEGRIVLRTIVLVLALVMAHGSADAAARKNKAIGGVASFYNQRGKVATGVRYNPNHFTAAHRTLPFGTRLRVTDPKSGRSVRVVVNDRGPFKRGRMLDLSLAAARALKMTNRGLLRVRVAVE